jgi:hypothetical protein
MGFIKDIPSLKGDNYTEWKKKIDLAFVLVEVDWVVVAPIFKDKNRMHKVLMCAPGHDCTHK